MAASAQASRGVSHLHFSENATTTMMVSWSSSAGGGKTAGGASLRRLHSTSPHPAHPADGTHIHASNRDPKNWAAGLLKSWREELGAE